MARLTAYGSVDMSYVTTSFLDVLYVDEDVVIVGDDYAQVGYLGEFSYPNGEWKGTITGVVVYVDDDLLYEVSGLDIGAIYGTASKTVEQTYRKSFRDDDTFTGSDFDDYLAAYAGDDLIRGGFGNDALHGMSGRDKLVGGSGRDSLWGGASNDALYGGAGNDALRGGAGRDLLQGGSGNDAFIFYDADGVDRIADFEDGRDRIRILDGAEQYSDIRVGRYGEDVKIVYADTIIILEDVARRDIDAADFTFA